MGTTVPFNRQYRKLIKKYIYKDIEKLGWLVTKAVVVKGRFVGTVSFIVDKVEIYNFIKKHIALAKKILIIDLAASFGISFLVVLAFFIRYRGSGVVANCPEAKKSKSKPKGGAKRSVVLLLH